MLTGDTLSSCLFSYSDSFQYWRDQSGDQKVVTARGRIDGSLKFNQLTFYRMECDIQDVIY